MATGQSRVLAKFDQQVIGRIDFFRRSLAWTPDGQTVLVIGQPGDKDGDKGGDKGGIWAYPAGGGAPKLLLEGAGNLADAAVSPDGKRLSYTEHRAQWDLWLLENFLPKGGK